MKSLNQKTLCYLTEDANSAVTAMVAGGLDQDLAIALLESVWPEEDIYALEEDEVPRERP